MGREHHARRVYGLRALAHDDDRVRRVLEREPVVGAERGRVREGGVAREELVLAAAGERGLELVSRAVVGHRSPTVRVLVYGPRRRAAIDAAYATSVPIAKPISRPARLSTTSALWQERLRTTAWRWTASMATGRRTAPATSSALRRDRGTFARATPSGTNRS